MARTVISCIVITCILSVTQWDAGTLLYGKPPHKQQKTLLQSIGQTQIRVDEEDLPKSFYKFSLNKFIDTYKKGVPEKLYLQLDKPYYCAGETIWFKGYLLNAVTLSYPRPTRFIYVELVDKRDSVRRRIKVIENWNGFHNNLNLPRNLPSGHYLLRGYTQWMQNEDEAFFFKKVIPDRQSGSTRHCGYSFGRLVSRENTLQHRTPNRYNRPATNNGTYLVNG